METVVSRAVVVSLTVDSSVCVMVRSLTTVSLKVVTTRCVCVSGGTELIMVSLAVVVNPGADEVVVSRSVDTSVWVTVRSLTTVSLKVVNTVSPGAVDTSLRVCVSVGNRRVDTSVRVTVRSLTTVSLKVVNTVSAGAELTRVSVGPRCVETSVWVMVRSLTTVSLRVVTTVSPGAVLIRVSVGARCVETSLCVVVSR